jgi:putative transposase
VAPECPAVAASREDADDKLVTFSRFPKSQWKLIRTSNAIVVRQTHHEGLHAEFKRQIKTQAIPPPELVGGGRTTAAMLFWGLLASEQITMRKVDEWQSLAEMPYDQILDLAA